MQENTKKISPFLVILIVGFIFNYEISLGYRSVAWDTLDSYFPYFLTIVDGVKSGSFPIIDPYYQSGVYIPILSRTWFYTLYAYPFILTAQYFNPLIVFGNMLLVYGVIGGFGFYIYSQRITKSLPLSVLLAVIYMLGSIFIFWGQLAYFLTSIIIPWYLLIAHLYLHTKKIDFKLYFALVLVGVFIVGASPWDLLIIFIFVGLYILIHAPLSIANTFNAIKILLIPALIYFAYQYQGLMVLHDSYELIQSDYASPDPRLRSIGVQHPQLLIDSVYHAFAGVFDAKFGNGKQWTYGISFVPMAILLVNLVKADRPKNLGALTLLTFSFILFIAYTSPNQLNIFNLIKSIPIINSNRWFGYGLIYAQLFFLLLVMHIYAHENNSIASRNPELFKCIFMLSFIYVLYFYSLLGIYSLNKKSDAIALGINNGELINVIRDRNPTNFVVGYERKQFNQSEYVYSYRVPMVSKTPISHGFSIVGDPLYWYFKDTWLTKSIFHVSDKFQSHSGVPVCSDDANLCVKSYAEFIVNSYPLNTLKNYPFSSIEELRNLDVKLVSYAYSANKLEVELTINKPALFFFNTLHFPGWTAKVNSKKKSILSANGIFMAVELEHSGINTVEFIYVDHLFNFILPIFHLFLLLIMLSLGVKNLFISRNKSQVDFKI